MQHAFAPALRQSGYGGQIVLHAGRQQQTPRHEPLALGDHREGRAIGPLFLQPVRAVGPAGTQAHGRIGENLGAGLFRNHRGIDAILRQETVRMGGKAIAPQTLVDDQHRAARAAELDGCGKAGIAAADDDDVVDCIVHGRLLDSRHNISGVKVAVKTHATFHVAG